MNKATPALLLSKQIKACEQWAIQQLGISENELMSRAGLAAFKVMRQRFPQAKKVLVYAGSGNNAGDGFVLAQLAHQAGLSVQVHAFKSIELLPPAATLAAQAAISAGVPCYFDDNTEFEPDIIIDALLGTGIQGKVTEVIAAAISQINDCNIPIIAMDLPSGLHADTGQVMGIAVKANVSVSFIARKLGMMTAEGPENCGEIVNDDLGIGQTLTYLDHVVQLIQPDLPYLPKRNKNCHKKDFGHVLIIGGNHGMPGSVCLTAKAALRVGAGMVTVALRPEYANHTLEAIPEAMVYGVETVKDIEPLLAKATICVLGPGLGEDSWAQSLYQQALASQLPMIVDASALRLLAVNPQHDDNWILTPHPGEAAALLGVSTQAIQADRLQAVRAIQQQYGGNVLLKGVGTLVQTEHASWLCGAGNPGMASAGMGDVLSGVLAALVAQGLSLASATTLGVYLHARAGDYCAHEEGEKGMLASDLLPFLRYLVNTSQDRLA